MALSYFQCKTYSTERGEAHWKKAMVTPITKAMITANKMTFSPLKNYRDWPDIMIEATSVRAIKRPSSMSARERLNNKYLSLLSHVGRQLGLNKKKANFKRRLCILIGVPSIILICIIILLTLKCPSDKITSTPWKPVWFGGCHDCKPDETLSKNNGENFCAKNQCFCDNGNLTNSIGQRQLCDKDQAQKCSSCESGYHLERDEDQRESRCILNQCTCFELDFYFSEGSRKMEIGQATNGLDLDENNLSQCSIHDIPSCKTCENGRYLFTINSYSKYCLKNQCKCFKGNATTFTDCIFHGAEHCQTCDENANYYLTPAIVARSKFEVNSTPRPLGLMISHADQLETDSNGSVTKYNTMVCKFKPNYNCKCSNGIVADLCLIPDGESCKFCNRKYYLDPPLTEGKVSICRSIGKSFCESDKVGLFTPQVQDFASCQALTEINMSGTEIILIHERYFTNTIKLRVLRLARNLIEYLPPNMLVTTSELILLDLSDNKITNIQANLFNNNPKLTTLYLNNNAIYSVEIDAFQNLPIQSLNHQGRKIRSNGYQRQSSLETLHLFDNYLAADIELELKQTYGDIQTFLIEKDSIVVCKCQNGSPSYGNDCSGATVFDCRSCDVGYYLENGVCKINSCTCSHGIGNEGLECPITGQESCASCFAPYTLTKNLLDNICRYNISPEDWYSFYYEVETDICPSGHIVASFGNTVSQAVTWEKAQELCNSADANLVSVTNQFENDLISQQIQPNMRESASDISEHYIRAIWTGLNESTLWVGKDQNLKTGSKIMFLEIIDLPMRTKDHLTSNGWAYSGEDTAARNNGIYADSFFKMFETEPDSEVTVKSAMKKCREHYQGASLARIYSAQGSKL